MKYSDFAIEQLTKKLAEIFNKKSTPTKTAALMLEAMEVIKQLQKAAALPPNPPLALDELQEMDGEPVWVKGINGSHIKSGSASTRAISLMFTPFRSDSGIVTV